MTPITRFIRAFRRFNADNIALQEAFLRAQRPWESETEPTRARGTATQAPDPQNAPDRWTLAG